MTELVSPPAERRPATQTSMRWAWMGLLALLTLFFFLSFFNRFAGLRSGNGEFTTGMWMLRGTLPYRDYFSATPPLNTLKSAGLLQLFGPYLIVSRAAGVLERVLIAIILFKWLCRLFPMRYAFTGALVTVILSAGDLVDPIASYNHDAIFCAMVSGYMASFALEEDRLRLFTFAVLSGFAAGLSLATKQTVGFGAAILVPIAMTILLANAGYFKRGALWLAGFASGCAVPILALAMWMHHFHILRTFLTMAFLKGPAAKGGGIGAFVLRELLVAQNNWFLAGLGILAVFLSVRALVRSQQDSIPLPVRPASSAWLDFRRLGLGFAAAILGGEALGLANIGALHNLSKSAVYFVFIVTAGFVAGYSLRMFRVPLTPRQRQFALFAAVSFFVAFFLSLSWPAFEAMALPGLGLLVAATLDGAKPKSRRAIYCVLGLLVFFQTMEKLDLPFAFDGLNEGPVRRAVGRSTIPELRGMRLPPDTLAFLQGSLDTIAANAKPSDTFLTYPEMSLFYELTARTYPTVAASHNVDVVDDAFAKQEAMRVLAARPAVVIYMPRTPDEMSQEDKFWWFGRASAQHTLVTAIESLTGGYEKQAVYAIGPERRPIEVFVRPRLSRSHE